MKGQSYTEEELRGKKYGELFKIGKVFGVKSSKKLKTDKLIEAILVCQDGNTSARDVAEIAAVADDEGKDSEKSSCVKPQQQEEIEPKVELLSDIQLPELLPLDDDELQKVVGKSSKTGCLAKNEGKYDDVNERKVKKRCRTGTFEIKEKIECRTEEENTSNLPKRQRTSTYEIPNKAVDQNLSIEVSSVATSQQIEDNNEQINILMQNVSKRRTRNAAIDFTATVSPSALPNNDQLTLPSKKEHLANQNSRTPSKLNLLHENEVSKVAPATEPPSDIINKSESKLSKARSITHLKPPKTATSPSRRKTQTGVKLTVNTPKSNAKVTQASKIVKPVFTIGRNNTSPVKKERVKKDGSSIPRFLSYARGLKMPNFAKIHEQAFNRMEALDDYIDKKRKRTDTIGSATKKSMVAAEAVFQPTVTSTRNINLSFMSTRSPANKTPGFSKSKVVQFEGSKCKSLSLASAQKVTKKSPKVAETPQNTMNKVPKSSSKSDNMTKKTSDSIRKPTSQPTEESPKQKHFKGSVKKVATFRRKSAKTPPGMASVKRDPSPGHSSTLPRTLKENIKPVNMPLISPAPSKLVTHQNPPTSGSLSTRFKYDSKTTSNIPSSRIPYKCATKSLTNRDTLKNMVQRNPKTKSRQEIREGQKKILKGVRFNRRFELQMANRRINL